MSSESKQQQQQDGTSTASIMSRRLNHVTEAGNEAEADTDTETGQMNSSTQLKNCGGNGFIDELAPLLNRFVIRVPRDCDTIELALNRAAKGDIHTIFLSKGVHYLSCISGQNLNCLPYLNLDIPITIRGENKIQTIIEGGGFMISKGDQKSTQDKVIVQNLTMRNGNQAAINNIGGMPCVLEHVLITGFKWRGINIANGASASLISTCVMNCIHSGVVASKGSEITISGKSTQIIKNGTVKNPRHYGVRASGSTSSIHFIRPLTKDIACKHNKGLKGNYGGHGTIDVIGRGFKNIQTLQSHSGKFKSSGLLQTSKWTCCGDIFKKSKWCGVLSVPECCKTIEQAVDLVKNFRIGSFRLIHTIVLGIGIHVIKKDYITIDQPLKIVGMDEIDTVVTGGGFQIRGDKNVTLPSMVVELKHFTVKKSKNIGICNVGGLPLLMKDVRLIGCGGHGVAIRESKAQFIDVQVTKCAMMGITISNGANLTLSGEETLIAGNCTTSMARHYGLHAAGAASIVRVLDSLVLENVVKNNGGGGNFGSQSGGVVGVGVVSRNSIVVAENEVDVVVEIVEEVQQCRLKRGSSVWTDK